VHLLDQKVRREDQKAGDEIDVRIDRSPTSTSFPFPLSITTGVFELAFCCTAGLTIPSALALILLASWLTILSVLGDKGWLDGSCILRSRALRFFRCRRGLRVEVVDAEGLGRDAREVVRLGLGVPVE
jgi:hypothetical protein